MPHDDDNSVCSNDNTEDVEVKEKEDEEEENVVEEDDEEDDEDEEDDDDEEDDENEEYDPAIIQYELLKNFLVDEDGTNVATHLGAIAHELRRLNKVLLKNKN
jgi:hypothetical protein